MKRLVYILLILITMDLIFQSCANPKSPNGGPKDTIPPEILLSTPANGQTQFAKQELRLTFSEYINADNLRQKLIITPKTDINFKSIAKKNELIIKFEQPFADSTTYNLNFADGVTDITEKNPAINLSVAFSTGPYIDSMQIKGQVRDLYSQSPAKAYLVGLYPATDSLDVFTDPPIYFTTTNDSGNFQLQYIKSAKYKLITFNDENGNVLLDPDTEKHGFLSGNIQLDSATTLSQPIEVLLQNITPIQLINNRPSGRYVEIKYNKEISNYHLVPDYLDHNITGENKDVIRVYKPNKIGYQDSTELIISAHDSLKNTTQDTIQIVFLESNRKPATFNYSVSTKTAHLTDDQTFNIQFNKPIKNTDSTKFSFQLDSTFTQYITPKLKWNQNKTELELNTGILRDSLRARIRTSLPTAPTDTIAQNYKQQDKLQRISSISFTIDENAFISVEGDSTIKKQTAIKLNESASYGTIQFTIDTEYKDYNIQLLNSNTVPVYQQKNKAQFTFPKIAPGNYTIRVLIDSNKDGTWTPGNLLLDQQPEQIYLHPDKISVRENWVIEVELSF